MVASVVRLHGGTATAQSAGRGLGSTFTIDLPLSDDPATATNAIASRGKQAQANDTLRVLVVDDNEDAAALLADALGMLGCDVRVAHDGPAAISVAAAFDPEVALLDIGLPVMDGYELASRLRLRDPQRDHEVRLVAITGYGQNTDRERTARAGFDAHLVKPVDVDHIARLIDRWRGHREPGAHGA